MAFWKCIDRVMFKKSAEMSRRPSPVAYCGCCKEKHTVIIISQGTVSELKSNGSWRSQAVEGQQPAAVCFCSKDMRLKVREQVLHWYFLTSAWVCRCARRLERSAKARLQCGQENGRSPVGKRERD